MKSLPSSDEVAIMLPVLQQSEIFSSEANPAIPPAPATINESVVDVSEHILEVLKQLIM